MPPNFPVQPPTHRRNRVELQQQILLGVGDLAEPQFSWQLITPLWVSIEPQGAVRLITSEYIQGHQQRGRVIHIIRGKYTSDLNSLYRFVHGFRIFNIDRVIRAIDNTTFDFEAVCWEDPLPKNYISYGTSWLCYQNSEALIY